MTTNIDPNKLTDDFFDMSEIDDLDRQISELVGRETLVDKMTERSDQEASRRTRWANDFRKYWYVYVFLIVSALFTGTLGIYMGMSPTLEIDPLSGLKSIHWNTDFGHVMLAVVYLVTFVGVTEFQVAMAKNKFHTREEANNTQYWTMLLALIIGFIGIVGTGIAGGSIIASNIAFMTEYQEIPASAQNWVVKAIPILLAIYAALYIAYALSSGAAKAERVTNENKRKQDLDHKTRMDAIEQIAERQLQAAEIQIYKRLFMSGRMSRAEVMAAIRAGKSLAQTEVDLGRDLNDDNTIGGRPIRPGTATPSTPPDIGPQYKTYTLDQLLMALGMSLPEAYHMIQDYQLKSPGRAFQALRDYQMLPADLLFDNFRDLFNQLINEGVRANGANVGP